MGDDGYILAEIWKARTSWLALSTARREALFKQRIGPLIGTMITPDVMNADMVEL